MALIKNGVGVITPAQGWGSHAPLSYGILDVILLSTKKQVLWVNARTIVAPMANIHSLGNDANMHLVAKDMRSFWASTSGADAHLAVPIVASGPKPDPAAGRFVLVDETVKAIRDTWLRH